MVQTQQYAALDTTDGADLAAVIGWSTVGLAGATTGIFTLYSSASPTTSNGIVGAWHKPLNAATKTGANIARAFATGFAGGILAETSVTVSVRHRISSNVNGSGNGWPTGGGTDVVFGVIARASGTLYATHNWYEIGFVALADQSTGTLRIRKNRAGTNTDLASTTISLPFVYPSYSTASSPSQPPANLWATVVATLTNSGGNVIIHGTVTIDTPGGQQVFVGNVTDSVSPITAAGYGGFWTSGNAASANSLVSHFRDFTLTVTAGGATDPIDPPDAVFIPALIPEVAFTPVTIVRETGTSHATATLPVNPQFPQPFDHEFFTKEFETESGWFTTYLLKTKARRAWKLTWHNISTADEATLTAFFAGAAGGVLYFLWTPPHYETPIKMAFHGEWNVKINDVGVRGAEIAVLEVFV